MKKLELRKPIKDLNELKTLCSKGEIECYIMLRFGVRSSKEISYDEKSDTWYIYNEASDSEQEVTTANLKEATNIIEALEKGALYQY